MISPSGTPTCSTGVRLHVRPVKGLHQEREKGPPNAKCMASQQGIFPHLPVSPFRRSIPWRWHNNHVPWWKEARRRAFLPHASTNTHSWGMFLRERGKVFFFQKRFKLVAETLTPFYGFNKEDRELWLSKNKYKQLLSFKDCLNMSISQWLKCLVKLGKIYCTF